MKQQQITYDKGITYVPSDALCSDNALSECMGMTYENGEMKPIQKAEEYITSAVDKTGTSQSIPFMLYIHKFNNQERYIGYILNGGVYYLCWGTRNKVTKVYTLDSLIEVSYQSYLQYTEFTRVTSVGKILIVSNEDGIHYFLWTKNSLNNDVYESLGTAFPRPEVEFYIGDWSNISEKKSIQASGVYYANNLYHINQTQQADWNNTVVGTYTSLRKNIWQKKAFVGSFCVRAALELYDGSYYHIENPVLMVNQFSSYCVGYLDGTSNDGITFRMGVHGQKLYYKFSKDYRKWSDIVKNVVLFVTRESNRFDTASDAILEAGSYSTHSSEPLTYFMAGNKVYADSITVGGNNPDIGGISHIVLNSNPDSDVEESIRDGVYYKLCEIGLYGDGEYHCASDNFDTHKLENITTQPQLITEYSSDDYYSHCDLKAGMLYSYNSRLNLAQVERGMFDGFDFFMPFTAAYQGTEGEPVGYKFFVYIETDGGTIIVSKSVSTKNKQGIYFYYPDPRAKRVVIKKDNDYILDEELKEHPTMNGSYYFAGISPTMDEPGTITAPDPVPVPSTDKFELLPNYIITSEVNNPFVFRPEGYYKVGTGRIIGMSTITQALSEGQFGQFPLLVFSENGIWALTVGSTGYYTSIHPISREVCSNEKSITQTDGAVYFVSKKGLMIIVGSTVKCVSEQLDGKIIDNTSSPFQFVLEPDFKGYLDKSIIAYDYRDSQLLLIDPNKGVQWVYNMKSSTFSKAKMLDATEPQKVIRVLNDYPDNLIQGDITTQGGHKYQLFSLLEKPDENGDTSTYSGTVLTRPMKLENGLSLKTIMDLKNIYAMEGTLTLYIYGSNNCKNWLEINSLTGVPWKYYRFKIVFSSMKATDRFSGTVLVTQERRTNKLR